MDVTRIDGYLLAGDPAKAALIAELAALPADGPQAPFLRALRAVGIKAADETLVALRLAVAGRTVDDTAVRRLRALAALVRTPAAAAAILSRDGDAVADVAAATGSALASAARAAYERELQPPGSGTSERHGALS